MINYQNTFWLIKILFFSAPTQNINFGKNTEMSSRFRGRVRDGGSILFNNSFS